MGAECRGGIVEGDPTQRAARKWRPRKAITAGGRRMGGWGGGAATRRACSPLVRASAVSLSSLSLSPDHHGIALHRPLGAVHELWLGAFTVVDRDGADAMLEQEAPIG